MSKSKDLDAAVHDVIKAGQIGRPVFVRLVDRIDRGSGQRGADLARLALVVQRWFGDSIARVHGIETSGYALATVLLQFRGGASALVSIVVDESKAPASDLILLGNHGAIYHEAARFVEFVTEPTFSEENREFIRSLGDTIERAFRTGQPQLLPAEDAK